MKVNIKRQWDSYRMGTTELEHLEDLHWDEVSGGVNSFAIQPFIHGYVLCTQIDGEIDHSCQHGPPPHRIKVCMLKKDNDPEVWKEILSLAGSRPKIERASPYYPDDDAAEIVQALKNQDDHPAIEKRKGLLVIKPRNIPDLEETTDSIHTKRRRAKAIVAIVSREMEEDPMYEQAPYGYYLAYRLINSDG